MKNLWIPFLFSFLRSTTFVSGTFPFEQWFMSYFKRFNFSIKGFNLICLFGMNLGPLPIRHMPLLITDFYPQYFGEMISIRNVVRPTLFSLTNWNQYLQLNLNCLLLFLIIVCSHINYPLCPNLFINDFHETEPPRLIRFKCANHNYYY